MKKGNFILLASMLALLIVLSLIFVLWKRPDNAQSQLINVTFTVREDHPNFDGQKFVVKVNDTLSITKSDFIVIKYYDDREERVKDFELNKNYSSEDLAAGTYNVTLSCDSFSKKFDVVVNLREINLINIKFNQNEFVYSGKPQKINITTFDATENGTVIEKNILGNVKFSYKHYFSLSGDNFGITPTSDLSKAGYYKTVAKVESIGEDKIYKISENQDVIEHFWKINKREISLDGMIKWGNAQRSLSDHYIYQPNSDFKMNLSITDSEVAKAFSISKTTIYYSSTTDIQSSGGEITQDLTKVGFYRAEADVELVDNENYICSEKHFTQWWQVFSNELTEKNIKLCSPYVNGGTVQMQDIRSQTIDIVTVFDGNQNAEIIFYDLRCDGARMPLGTQIKAGYYVITVMLRIREDLLFSENVAFADGRYCSFSFTIVE